MQKFIFKLIVKSFPFASLPPTFPIPLFYISQVYVHYGSHKTIPMLVNRPDDILYLSLVKNDLSLATHMHWLINLFPDQKKKISSWNIHVFENLYVNITEEKMGEG